MPALLARHNEILHQAIQSQNGYVFQIVGDSFAVACHSASDALNAALEAQQALQSEAWNPAPIKVRMGIHTSVAQLTDKNHRSARGCALGPKSNFVFLYHQVPKLELICI